jgi:hypothetical protein
MRPDDQSRKGSSKRERHQHERRQDPHGAPAPRSWTSKTMHHPATRIGEIKHGKS